MSVQFSRDFQLCCDFTDDWKLSEIQKICSKIKFGQIYYNGIIAFAFQDDFCNSSQEWSYSWFTKDAETPLVCFLLSINSPLGYISHYIKFTLLNITSYINLIEIETGAATVPQDRRLWRVVSDTSICIIQSILLKACSRQQYIT